MESGFRELAASGMTAARALVRAAGVALFPHRCAGCGAEGSVLCAPCGTNVQDSLGSFFGCARCGTAVPFGARCPRPRCRESALGAAAAMASYAHPVLRSLLQQYKYGGVVEAGERLAEMFGRFALRHREAFRAIGPCMVVAMPLHPLRERLRGFNQSDALAEAFAAAIGAPRYAPSVRRPYMWKAQAAQTDHGARLAAMGLSFDVGDDLRGAAVIIVDDVLTTGATASAFATALARAGAGSVDVATLLRG